jgi:proline iminopeptidase
MDAQHHANQLAPREGTIPVDLAALWYRDVGHGQPIIILHGGPDFDCNYLLPELDRLADGLRLIYYDQRGRGKSARNVQPEDVSLHSDIADIERVRRAFQLDAVAVLGHSWGGLLGMEYALRHPERVSHLILLNTAFASNEDRLLFQEARRTNAAATLEKMRVLAASAGFQEGDPETVAAYYRLHYSTTVRQPAQLDALIDRLSTGVTRESMLKSRAIEARLLQDTWLADGYDLLPALRRLRIPTLVIHGEADFIPIQCAARIADAIPEAHFVLLPDCGHFSYLECPEAVRTAIDAFFQRVGQPRLQ